MSTKNLITVCILILLLACKKNNLEGNENSFTDKIVLSNIEVTDRKAKLTWTILKNVDFAYYEIYRRSKYQTNFSPIGLIGSRLSNVFIDSIMPYTPYLEYKIIAFKQNNDTITSNTLSHFFPDLTLSIKSLQKQGDSIIINWDALTNPNVKDYTLLRRQSENDPYYPVATVGKTINSIIDTNYYYGKNIGYIIQASFPNSDRIYSEEKTIAAEAKITLTGTFTSDSVTLNWTPLMKHSLMNYQIVRKLVGSNSSVIAEISDAKTTRFVDKTAPFYSNIEYQIIGDVRQSDNFLVNSNITSYSRPEIITIFNTMRTVEFDKVSKLLFFFDIFGKINIVNTNTNKVVKSIDTQIGEIGFCDFGTFNNVREIYLPAKNGTLYIYNAQTFEKITDIYIGGKIASVVNNHGLLYVASDQKGIVVYNRATKSLVTSTQWFGSYQLRLIPNTDSDLTAIFAQDNHNYLSILKFGNTGEYKSGNFTYSIPLSLDQTKFSVLPEGDKFIINKYGDIFSSNFTYYSTLPVSNFTFTSFDFIPAKNQILASTTLKTIEIYSNPGYNRLRSIQTKLYPLKVFIDDNRLIVIGSVYNVEQVHSSDYLNLTIEYINI